MKERTADVFERWWTGEGDKLPYNLVRNPETLRSNARSCPLLMETIDVKSLSWISVEIECILDIQRQMKSTCSYEEG